MIVGNASNNNLDSKGVRISPKDKGLLFCKSMGAIADRTQEQLCNGDQVIVRARRMYIQLARDFCDGKALDAESADLRHVRSWSFITSADDAARWSEPQLRCATEAA